MTSPATHDLDVLVVGAGLSGIAAGYHLSTSLPEQRWEIVEARDRLGGTWDLFRYPGVRSDSDMHTLGFPFKPWTRPESIAAGSEILSYLEETAAEFGITPKIRFGQRVTRARWSSKDARWEITLSDTTTSETRLCRARFLFVCAGYYDYEKGHTPVFPGVERFAGPIVHPQGWPQDLQVRDRRVVVIGSGATAMTLVPELAKEAAHVVMLQRSPTYVLAAPRVDPVVKLLERLLPRERASELVRWKNVLLGLGFYDFCRSKPRLARRLLTRLVERRLHGKIDVSKHFTPRYDPWDQRLCLITEGDLFDALVDGRASIETDTIRTFTERGILLDSSKELAADVVVTATGLELRFLGGVELEVNGEPIQPAGAVVYKGMMLSDVPNLAFAVGYTNASWTLKCDLTARYVCRLLRHMKRHHATSVTPRVRMGVHTEPLLDFSSGYVQRAIDRFPRQGSASPWRVHQNYLRDLALMRFGRVDDGAVEFAG